MTTFVKIMANDELAHVGVMGMRWGKRSGSSGGSKPTRSQKKASKLSTKYEVKVGEGVTKKDILGSAALVGQMKTTARFDAVEKFSNDTVSYYAKVNGKQMTDTEFKRATDKTNKILDNIDKTKITELSIKYREDGKRYVDIKLNE